MVGYDKYAKGYNIFDPSYKNTFIERNVQFEEELMQEVDLVEGDCSNPPINDDVSDFYLSDFFLLLYGR